jgi:hypothetical protein
VTKTSNLPSEYDERQKKLLSWEADGKYAKIFGNKKIESMYIGYSLLKIDSFLCNNFSKTDIKYRQIINEVYLYPKPIWPKVNKKAMKKKKLPRKVRLPKKEEPRILRRSTRNRKLPELKF